MRFSCCEHSMVAGQHVFTSRTANCVIHNMLKMSYYYLCLFLCVANAFNLEPRIPVLKLGDKDSYFGYSVAEHQILDTTNSVQEHVGNSRRPDRK
ncbi:uncharacterized protein TNCT_308481 [Trichonephila clavata]|uniref:Uncharacterized protein n=1 Tax=Trichonephila clavata TaxID=2740835 RepID=A0A8X6M2H5_TRICU|nr:uncharacterized protein TNCT_308481 [Trichonephila clavata]